MPAVEHWTQRWNESQLDVIDGPPASPLHNCCHVGQSICHAIVPCTLTKFRGKLTVILKTMKLSFRIFKTTKVYTNHIRPSPVPIQQEIYVKYKKIYTYSGFN